MAEEDQRGDGEIDFDVDGTQLVGHTRRTCFMLGFEFMELLRLAEANARTGFATKMHAGNVVRIGKFLAAAGFTYRFHDDVGDQTNITVDPHPAASVADSLPAKGAE